MSTVQVKPESEGYQLPINKIIQGDALSELRKFPTECINTVITSPPYYALRNYHVQGQIGLEPTVSEYIGKLVDVFDEVKRVLKNDGSLWVVLGDSYDNKSLVCTPERFALAMIDAGWILRNKIVWRKLNPMPSPIKDRFTIDFENVYWFVRSDRYYFKTQYEPYLSIVTKKQKWSKFGGTKGSDGANHMYSGEQRAVNPRGRIQRTTWSIPTSKFNGNHYATFSEALVVPMVESTCPPDGLILDSFCGTATTGVVAYKSARRFVGIELNKDYCKIAERRLRPYLQQTLISSYSETIKHEELLLSKNDYLIGKEFTGDSSFQSLNCAERIEEEAPIVLENKISSIENKVNNLYLIIAQIKKKMNRGGESKFNCSVCGETFTRSHGAKRHIANKHPANNTAKVVSNMRSFGRLAEALEALVDGAAGLRWAQFVAE